jgi:hypothetical protein
MKKKIYMTPDIQVVEIEMTQLLAASGITSDGIEWGGVDTEGTLDPAAPGMPNMGEIVGLPDFILE